MAPISIDKVIEELVNNNEVAIFSKSFCPFCKQVKTLFNELEQPFGVIELDHHPEGDAIQALLIEQNSQRTVPQVYIGQKFIGGADSIKALRDKGELTDMLKKFQGSRSSKDHKYDYDLVVIGGGSGGLACVKEAAAVGMAKGKVLKLAVCDFVKPTPIGTTWGIGGTCVNVGCIPKKLFHRASLLGEAITDAKCFGWRYNAAGGDSVNMEDGDQDDCTHKNLANIATHNWNDLKNRVNSHIKSLNFKYRNQLRTSNIDVIGAYAKFVDKNTLSLDYRRKRSQDPDTITASKFVIATGLRPKYPDIPGAREYGITSDDVFTLKYPPGKTLCIGGSYVSLECAGFLKGIGFDVDVMVRSIFLRGFDQDMAERIGAHMADVVGIKFYRPYVPIMIQQLEAPKDDNSPGKLLVTMQNTETKATMTQEYNTVLFAIGREPIWKDMNFEGAGIETNPKTGKILVDNQERTSNPNIFALGDAIDNWELTPVAIQAGNLLARRLFGKSTKLMDYTNVPTTVFTPLEYGSIGMAEEDAEKKFGKDDIEVYHSAMSPLEWTLPARPDTDKCYLKLICVKSQKERVVGLHVLGPDAGEITQGYGVAFKCGATLQHFQDTVGIHPTNSELFTTLKITKASGLEVTPGNC